MWLICSFIVRESGTIFTAVVIRSCSVSSRSSRRAWVSAEMTHCSISAPVQPLVNCVSCPRLKRGRIHAAPGEVDAEDLDLLVVERQIDEEHLVEAALANHLGGQQVDAVGGCGDEEARASSPASR